MSENETQPVKQRSSKVVMPYFVNDLKSEAGFSVNEKRRGLNPELIDAETFVIPIKYNQ